MAEIEPVSELEILYRDEYLVAVNKPSGLLVHRSMIDRHETRFAMQMVRNQIGQHVYPVHRLDKPTSGVLVFALSSDMARRMMELFSSAAVNKNYLAVVRGYSAEADVIDYPLKEELDKIADAEAQQDKAAQEAVTHFQRLATVELSYPVGRYETARYSLLKLQPQTGRKHQLRRHMKHIFHPIVGDTTHGDSSHNRFFRQQFNCHRLLLSATQMSFQHPISGESLDLCASLDDGFQRIMNSLGWQGIS